MFLSLVRFNHPLEAVVLLVPENVISLEDVVQRGTVGYQQVGVDLACLNKIDQLGDTVGIDEPHADLDVNIKCNYFHYQARLDVIMRHFSPNAFFI